MGIEKNPLAMPCVGCFFLGRNLGNCDYWLIMDKLRPYKPGKECTVKRKDAPPGYDGFVKWDTAFAKRMYDRGATDAEIAKAVGASIAELKNYRKSKWGKANHKQGEKHGGMKISWDAEKGLQLWLSGMSDAKIAEALGATVTAVSNYRKRKWMHLKDKRVQKSRTKWDTEKGFAMYQAGASDGEIARAMGVAHTTIESYRKTHWSEAKKLSKAQWDTERGKSMWLEGASYPQIAKELGVTRDCVAQYSRRHWRGEGCNDQSEGQSL